MSDPLRFVCIVFLCSTAHAETRVPAWSARGLGPLPRQGVACVEVSPDGSQIALGTISPPGDPNVIVISAEGKLLREHLAGQRWIGQVAWNRLANGSNQLHALCTTPAGRAADGPTVFACGETVSAIPNNLGEAAYPRTLFFYGEHSNHSGVQLAGAGESNAVLYGNQLMWLDGGNSSPRFTMNMPWPAEGVATVLAAHSSGAVVTGFSTYRTKDAPDANLFLAYPGEKQPRWQRAAVKDVGESRPPPKGDYGTPTLRDGSREELRQHDLPVVAPLSVALNRGAELTRIATADYPGYQRWIRSSATLREQNYGTRFIPARPTITVYDAKGEVLQRFDPAKFNHAGWLDLAFLPGDKQLFAYPHNWTSRGLAGQPRLPADDEARTCYWLDIATGDVNIAMFEHPVASAASNDEGQIAVSCWGGNCHLFTRDNVNLATIALGGPAIVRSLSKEAWVAATANGRVQIFGTNGKQLHQLDLDDIVSKPAKPWVTNAKAEKINDGLWQIPGGRVESDLGGQRVIEGPDGLILIEGHGGLSFEREWHALEAAGLDPRRVKYVLATHEHGDHAPGAYLWRVATGAQFICSTQMAYTLQHHLPLSTGYGLHPPVPTDIRIEKDEELDLAGVKVRALRLPGHTFGSMGWLVERGGQKYVAIGDLIMPEGVLGYSGSINFSGTDVLASLRKLEDLKVDFILPGHGPITSPERYVAAGIGVGRHVGWGKIKPESPDPRFRMTQQNVLVVGWNLDQTSADFGDLNGDGRPDAAIVVPEGSESRVKVFLNQGGKFAAEADVDLPVPSVAEATKLRVRELNGDGRLDLFVGGKSSALLLSRGDFPKFEPAPIGLGEGNQIRRIELGEKEPTVVASAKFGSFAHVMLGNGPIRMATIEPKVTGAYPDLWSGDLNGDGRSDLVYSYGQVLLRGADGKLPAEPSLQLPATKEREWSYFTVGDFNHDRRPDVVFFTMPQDQPRAGVFYNTGQSDAPFRLAPDAELDLADPQTDKKNPKPYLRDSVVAADWNNDGVTDLVVGKGQDNAVLIVPGGTKGLDIARLERIALDYRVHYETGVFVGDFNGDGKQDLACLGYTNTGVGSSGPLAVYIYLQR